ncbi:hypothetical protein FJY68_02485 [candidate division WOR-3 bacterium]|uniref:Uncharacterized protein n=1 Tax=candidate division WOR-3 bacterium TaxID=2052148 RepID=A0A938BT91_UNCW3|nr:hypothetical protein [candidate division WOR-3 bacterium]
MPRTASEVAEHDQLVLMMAMFFQKRGYSDIRADIPGWTTPSEVHWQNQPDQRYYPDLTCRDNAGVFVVLEAESCATLGDEHTHEQFRIFRAYADTNGGRFETVIPSKCGDQDARTLLASHTQRWGIKVDNVWTPSA